MSTQCLKCGYPVTEPICASCAINEIKVWLHEQKINKNVARKINSEIDSLLNYIESTDYVVFPSKNIWKISIMECVRCKREMHIMCFYCVTNQASKIIGANLKSKNFIKNFNESFNTNIQESFNKDLHEYFNTSLHNRELNAQII